MRLLLTIGVALLSCAEAQYAAQHVWTTQDLEPSKWQQYPGNVPSGVGGAVVVSDGPTCDPPATYIDNNDDCYHYPSFIFGQLAYVHQAAGSSNQPKGCFFSASTTTYSFNDYFFSASNEAYTGAASGQAICNLPALPYSAEHGFKFTMDNYNGITVQNSPGFETPTGTRFEPWSYTWNSTEGGYPKREAADPVRPTYKGITSTLYAIHENKSGTEEYVWDRDGLPESLNWATKWAEDHYYKRDGALDDKASEAKYRQHHAELHQNGPYHYSPGLFPELALDETHRYFMDGEAWPRTENEYRYSFKKWGAGYRAGTLVSEMNLGGSDDKHKYQFGQNYTNSTRSTGNQPDLFADAPNGGNQEVYTPKLEFSWTHKKYTALNAETENTYQEYINGRERLNGTDGNTVVKWNWDRNETNYEGLVSDTSVTSAEEGWNKKNSGVWGWNAGHPGVSGWNGTQTTLSNDPQHMHRHVPFEDGYATGPNGHALTTAIGDGYGWNTAKTGGFGKLDTFRTWNMNGRKV